MKSLLLLLSTITLAVLVTAQSHEDRLVAELLRRLGTSGSIARPVPDGNSSEPVSLSLGLSLLRVESLMSQESSAELDVWIQMYWNDPRLRWNPADFGGLRQVALPSSLIWIPDVRPFHAGNYIIDRVSPVLAVARSFSQVIYALPARLRAPCERLRNGSVRCRPVLGSWVHSSLQLNTSLSSNPLSVTEFEPLQNWTLARAFAERIETRYTCCPESYVSVKYTLVFNPKRGSGEGRGKDDKRDRRGQDRDNDRVTD